MKKTFILLITLLLFTLPQGVAANTLVDKRVTGEEMNCKPLDEDKSEELIEIANLIEEEDTEELIKRLNEQVLSSENTLLEEQQLLSLYPCLYRDDEVVTEMKHYLEIYTSTLTFFEQLFQKEEKIQIDSLSLKYVNRFRMYQLNATLDDKKEVETKLFSTTSADAFYRSMENEAIDKLANSMKITNIHYLKATIFDPLLTLLFKNPLGDAFDTAEDYEQEKENLAWEIEVKEALLTVGMLDTEFAIVEGDLGKREKQMREIYVYPITHTYDQLERWEEVHEINEEIPYPEEAIEEADWNTIGETLLKNESTMNEIDFAIYPYIKNDKLPDNTSVEDVAKGLSEQKSP